MIDTNNCKARLQSQKKKRPNTKLHPQLSHHLSYLKIPLELKYTTDKKMKQI